jgi:hypothetical protein
MKNLLRALNGEDRLIISSMIMTLGGAVLGAWMREPQVYGFTALAVMGMLITGWRITHSARLSWLLVFGAVAGVLALWADWVFVTYFGALVYMDYFGFQILASPSYMPIGWWLTVVQFGYLGLRLSDHWPDWLVIGTITALGMSVPPWYEQLAVPARAWHYKSGGLMLSNTPLWVILAYGGCMFAIATLALLFYRPQAWGRAVLGGVFTGTSFMFFGVFWFAWIGTR